MARNESEEGKMTMRPADVRKLRKTLVDAVNAQRVMEIELLNRKVAQILEANKGKRNVDWLGLVQSSLGETELWGLGITWTLEKALFPKGKDSRPVLLKSSSAEIRPVVKSTVTSLQVTDEFSVYFKAEEGIFGMEVYEGNHACDRAHANPCYKAMLAFLRQLDWPRGGGGEIWGNDEYNRDAGGSGGGGNYTVHSWEYRSPAQKKKDAESPRCMTRMPVHGFGYR